MHPASEEHLLPAEPNFDTVIETYSGMIWRICGSYEADSELRRDLHQDVLVAIWRALPKFRGDAKAKTYIARIAHNRAITHVSKAVKIPPHGELGDDLPTSAPGPEADAASAIRQEKLQATVRTLPLDQRQVVTLTLEGFAPREIADVLGVSANTVSIRLTRAKAVLKKAFEDDQ